MCYMYVSIWHDGATMYMYTYSLILPSSILP